MFNWLFILPISIFTFAAVSDYRQSLQFQNLNDEKRNIQLEVCFFGTIFVCFVLSCHGVYSFAICLQVIRGGRRVEVSIYDIVVGDVIPLDIGDQVCDFVCAFLLSNLGFACQM